MPRNFKELVDIFIDLIGITLPVLASLAFLVFVWGIAKFIFRIGGDEKAVEEGKQFITWGLVAMFVLLSFMAIISFFHEDIGFGNFGFPLLP